MRAFSRLHNTELVELVPDTIQTLLLAGGAGQAMGWAGSTIGSSDARAHIVRFSGISTAGALLNFNVNLQSTRAAAPSSGTSIDSTAGVSVPVHGNRYLQVPAGSTGWSAIALTSGYVTAELWSK